MFAVRNLNILALRLWMTVPFTYFFQLWFQTRTFPHIEGFFLEIPSSSVWVLLCILWLSCLFLLWSRAWKIALGLGFITQVIWINLNLNLFGGWGFILPALILGVLGRHANSAKLRTLGSYFLFFNLLAIYLLPSLDRLTGGDWFSGRILSAILSGTEARWPLQIDYKATYFWGIVSTIALLVEATFPIFAIFSNKKRKFFIGGLMLLHAILIVLTTIPVWNYFMFFFWLYFLLDKTQVQVSPMRLLIPTFIILLIFSRILPGKLRTSINYYYKDARTYFLKSGFLGFVQMKMYSRDGTPILADSKLRLCWDQDCHSISRHLQNYFWSLPEDEESKERFCGKGVKKVSLKWIWSSSDPVFTKDSSQIIDCTKPEIREE